MVRLTTKYDGFQNIRSVSGFHCVNPVDLNLLLGIAPKGLTRIKFTLNCSGFPRGNEFAQLENLMVKHSGTLEVLNISLFHYTTDPKAYSYILMPNMVKLRRFEIFIQYPFNFSLDQYLLDTFDLRDLLDEGKFQIKFPILNYLRIHTYPYEGAFQNFLFTDGQDKSGNDIVLESLRTLDIHELEADDYNLVPVLDRMMPRLSVKFKTLYARGIRETAAAADSICPPEPDEGQDQAMASQSETFVVEVNDEIQCQEVTVHDSQEDLAMASQSQIFVPVDEEVKNEILESQKVQNATAAKDIEIITIEDDDDYYMQSQVPVVAVEVEIQYQNHENGNELYQL